MISSEGTEWLIDATGCDATLLSTRSVIEQLVDELICEMSLSPIKQPLWHQFDEPPGITGMVMLAESHLTVHTFPEFAMLTLNIYSCKTREAANFEEKVKAVVGAKHVLVRSLARGIITLSSEKRDFPHECTS